jgi:phosphatidylglycerophosphatase C
MTDKKTNPHNKVFAFLDFDNTITRRDSFVDFLLFAVGIRGLIFSFYFLIPVLGKFFLHIITNEKAKEKVLSFFFKGMTEEELFKTGTEYGTKMLPRIIKKDAVNRIRWHKRQGHHVVVISASFDFWLKEWCGSEGVDLICSRMEIENGRVSGKIDGKNCYGGEKVKRIRERFDIENAYIYAYGDSKGDYEMLKLADEPFFRFFKR